MKKRYTERQIVKKLREIDILLGKGQTVGEACRQHDIAEQTYYRWRQKYGGMTPEMVVQLKNLEKSNCNFGNPEKRPNLRLVSNKFYSVCTYRYKLCHELRLGNDEILADLLD